VDPLGIVLIVAGVAAIAIAALQMRGPLATIRHLDATAANLDRYETWRGKSTGVEADGPTGADIMRQQMRQRLLLWGGVAAAGAVSIVVGLLLG
jgi:hypothetical protein